MTDDARYFFNRQGERSGPHPLDEIAAFIHAGEITQTSWVFREGDEKWQAATSFPELASILAAAAALSQVDVAAAPVSVSAAPSAATRPQQLTKVPYTAGQKPTTPGPYVRLAHLPAEAVALLTEAIPAPPPPHKRHPLRTLLILALWTSIVGAVVIDLGVGFDRWVFTRVLAPTALLGILVVMLATHSRPAEALARVRQSRPGSMAGLVGLALVFTCAGGLLFAINESMADARNEMAILVIVVAFVVLARALRDKPPAALTAKELSQVELMTVCRDVVAAVADDVAAGKAVTGWADLTGAQQPGKLMARGQATSGAKVELFRDEWLHVSAPLRDGTRLRVAAVDREKVKHAHSRTRGRKTKTKPGNTQTLATLEIRVRVHPQVYRPLAPAAQTGQVGGLLLSSITATADAVSAVFTRPSSGLQLADVLHALTHVYRHLERLPAAEGGAR